MPKNVQKFANFQVYPQNVFKPRMIPTLKLTLNPIFVLIIITHAQVFETIKKYGGQGYLAAPYYLTLGTTPKLKAKYIMI